MRHTDHMALMWLPELNNLESLGVAFAYMRIIEAA